MRNGFAVEEVAAVGGNRVGGTITSAAEVLLARDVSSCSLDVQTEVSVNNMVVSVVVLIVVTVVVVVVVVVVGLTGAARPDSMNTGLSATCIHGIYMFRTR